MASLLAAFAAVLLAFVSVAAVADWRELYLLDRPGWMAAPVRGWGFLQLLALNIRRYHMVATRLQNA